MERYTTCNADNFDSSTQFVFILHHITFSYLHRTRASLLSIEDNEAYYNIKSLHLYYVYVYTCWFINNGTQQSLLQHKGNFVLEILLQVH